jgi:hypothetical protein
VHDLGRWALVDPRLDSSAILPGGARERLEQARVACDILSIAPLLEPAADLIGASLGIRRDFALARFRSARAPSPSPVPPTR